MMAFRNRRLMLQCVLLPSTWESQCKGSCSELAGLSETEKWEGTVSPRALMCLSSLPPSRHHYPPSRSSEAWPWATAVSLGEGLTACSEIYSRSIDLQSLKWSSSLCPRKPAQHRESAKAGLPIGREKPASFPGRKEEKYLHGKKIVIFVSWKPVCLYFLSI